ncbi:MAG: hypothetical protein AAB364_00615 [Patescibacteria group bacterium]
MAEVSIALREVSLPEKEALRTRLTKISRARCVVDDFFSHILDRVDTVKSAHALGVLIGFGFTHFLSKHGASAGELLSERLDDVLKAMTDDAEVVGYIEDEVFNGLLCKP